MSKKSRTSLFFVTAKKYHKILINTFTKYKPKSKRYCQMSIENTLALCTYLREREGERGRGRGEGRGA